MLFAAQNPLIEHVQESWYIYLGLGLVVGFLIWVIIQVRTRLRDDTGHMADHWQLLQQMQDLHRQGDLTEEEYRSIKGRLITRGEEPPQQSPETSKQTIKEDCPDETSPDEQEARD